MRARRIFKASEAVDGQGGGRRLGGGAKFDRHVLIMPQEGWAKKGRCGGRKKKWRIRLRLETANLIRQKHRTAGGCPEGAGCETRPARDWADSFCQCVTQPYQRVGVTDLSLSSPVLCSLPSHKALLTGGCDGHEPESGDAYGTGVTKPYQRVGVTDERGDLMKVAEAAESQSPINGWV